MKSRKGFKRSRIELPWNSNVSRLRLLSSKLKFKSKKRKKCDSRKRSR